MRKYITILLIIASLTLLAACQKESDTSNSDPANEAGSQVVDMERPDDLPYGVWYEIFVRAFADSDGDGIGDFAGITEKLDYLNDGDPSTATDLGINGIWLMPINPSPSYHGYDVTDYYGVNPDYGTMEEFQTLLDEAHARGIKVIIDLVLNHSSTQHPWFLEASLNADSEYREYYRFEPSTNENINFDKQVWGHDVWIPTREDHYYYAIFWDQMPDLNYDTEALREEMIHVAKFWLDIGVDGFRVDAISHIFGAGELEKGVEYGPLIDEWWTEFRTAIEEVNPDVYLVGEAWETITARAKYADSFDTTFDFDLAEAGILTMVKNGTDYDVKNNGLISEMGKIQGALDDVSMDFVNGIFLTNHDMRRAMDYLNNDMTDMKLASLIYMTLPGNPYIYYGEEIGMLGDGDHEYIREPFIWGDEYQTSWKALEANSSTPSVVELEAGEDSLLNHYREIIRLRQGNEALMMGDYIGVETVSARVVAYQRVSDYQTLLIVHNVGDKPMETTEEELFAGVSYELIYEHGGEPIFVDGGIMLEGKSTVIYELSHE